MWLSANEFILLVMIGGPIVGGLIIYAVFGTGASDERE